MTPRRSSRARLVLPPASASATNSSTSSISSGRAERSTRSHHKVASPHRSNPRSQSLDDPDDAAKPPPRRTRSGHDEIKDPAAAAATAADDDIDEDEEEEVTRCVCGQTDYPGLPYPPAQEAKKVAAAAKDNASSSVSSDAVPDDPAGIFIQCDVCKVWQHGGCVGILATDEAPDEYFCEQCRKDLHEVATTAAGQRYSRYLPVHGNASKTASPAPNTRSGTSTKGRENKPRASAEALAAKRRPTMNSYDEQEQLRIAIEESKKDGIRSETGEAAARRPKRSRSDSDENHKAPIKRQRTGSKSSSPENEPEKSNALLSSSDEALASKRADEITPKKIRGAAARNHRDKEVRDQKERERLEAATRRKARSERRRGEDSDPSEEPTSQPQQRQPPSIHSSPPLPPSDPPSRSHKKGGGHSRGSSGLQPQVKSSRRQGRNQYTRDNLPPSSLHNSLDPNDGDSPLLMMRTRSRSRSAVRDTRDSPAPSGHGINGNGNGYTSGAGGGSGGLHPPSHAGNGNGNGNGHNGNGNGNGDLLGRPSRPKHLNPNRTSMNEMKKRVAGILEFVNRAQEEVLPPPQKGETTATNTTANGSPKEKEREDVDGEANHKTNDAPTLNVNGNGTGGGQAWEVEDFTSLSSGEMLRVLKKELVGWEDEFGRWSRG